MDPARSSEVPWGVEALRRKFCICSEGFFSMFGWRGEWDGAPVPGAAGESGAEWAREGTPDSACGGVWGISQYVVWIH